VEIRRLNIFCKVVELKSFTRASEAVLLSQPTISENIRLLEDAFGEKLLDRLGREVQPTPAGRILYQYARRMLQLRDEAQQALRQFRGDLTGTLALGASTIPGAYLLPGLVESFQRVHPTIRLRLKIGGSTQIVQDLLQGEVELAVVGALLKDHLLDSEELFTDELVLVAHPRHPWVGRGSVMPQELADQPFILRESGSGTRLVCAQALREVGFDAAQLQVVAEMGSTEAVRQCVKAGLGVSILSSLAVAEDIRQGALVMLPLQGLTIQRPLYLVQRKNRQLSPIGHLFLNHLLGCQRETAVAMETTCERYGKQSGQ
jgi:LysR family transcriptional regulator, low CO2-responsive transcriptional regulator